MCACVYLAVDTGTTHYLSEQNYVKLVVVMQAYIWVYIHTYRYTQNA